MSDASHVELCKDHGALLTTAPKKGRDEGKWFEKRDW